MAPLLASIIAAPMPWTTLQASSSAPLVERAHMTVATVNTRNPVVKTLLLPLTSPSLPNRRRKAESETR